MLSYPKEYVTQIILFIMSYLKISKRAYLLELIPCIRKKKQLININCGPNMNCHSMALNKVKVNAILGI